MLAVLDRKESLGVLRRHAEERREPHPEDGTGTARDIRRRHADDVARADGRGKSRAERAEAGDLTLRAALDLLVLEHVLERKRQADELHAAQTHGQQNSAEENEHYDERERDSSDFEGRAPDHVVHLVHVLRERIQPSGCLHHFTFPFRPFA